MSLQSTIAVSSESKIPSLSSSESQAFPIPSPSLSRYPGESGSHGSIGSIQILNPEFVPSAVEETVKLIALDTLVNCHT